MSHLPEAKTEHFHRIINTLKAVNNLLITEHNPEKLIRKICETFTQIRGYYFCWIGLFDKGGQLRIIESSGNNKQFDELKRDLLKGHLPRNLKKALKENTFVEVAVPPKNCPVIEEHDNYNSFICPITVDEHQYGLVCAAVPFTDAAHPKEAETFADTAKSIGYALSNLKTKQDAASFIAASNEAYITFDKELNFVSANTAFCTMFNCNEDFIVGKNMQDLVKEHLNKQNAKTVLSALKVLKKGGDVEDLQIEFDNRIYKVSSRINQLHKYRLGKVTDITKAYIERNELKKSESKYRKLVEGLNDSVFILQDDQIKYVNSTLCQTSGYTEEELLNQPFSKFIAESEVDKVMHRYRQRTEGKVIRNTYKSLAKTKHGTKIPVEVTVIPVEFEGKPALQVVLHNITERLKTIQNLEESEERYRFLADSAFEGIIIHKNGIILETNKAMAKLSGYTKKELVGKSIFDFLESMHDMDLVKMHSKNDKNNPYVVKATTKTGSTVFIEIESKGISYNGENVRIAGVRDITERQQLNKKLEDTTNQLHTLLNNLPGMAYACHNNKSWEMIFMSKGCIELTGYQPEDFIESDVFCYNDIIHPAYRDKVWEKVQNAITSKKPFEIEYKIITKNKEEKWVWERGRSVTRNSNEVLEGFISDITERKKATNAFIQSQTKYRSLFNAINDAIIIQDYENEDQKIIEVNEKACTLYGYSRSELLNSSVKQLSVGYTSWSEDKPERIYETLHKTKDNTTIPVEVNSSIFKIGKRRLIMSILRDISIHKNAEKKLTESEHLLNIVLQSMPSGFVMIDDNYRIRRVNEQACKITGYQRAELEGQECKLICSKPDCKKECPVWAKGVDSFTGMDTVIKGKGQSETAILKNAQTISINGERLVLESFQDITQLKQTEQELLRAITKARESEQKFAAFMNFLPGPAFIKDRELNFQYVNRFLEKNMNATTWVGKNTRDVIPENVVDNMVKDDEKAFLQGRHKYEEQFPVVGRGMRDFLTYKFTIGEDKALLGGISIDITERKHLESRNSMLYKAMEASPVSVVITDVHGNIEYVNPFFVEKTGYQLQEVIGRNPRVLKSGVQTPDFYKNMWNTILSGHIWHGEFHNKKKNGELYWEKGSISPITNGNAEIVQFIAIKEDITLQKQILSDLQIAKELAEKNEKEVIAQKDIVQLHNDRLESLFRISQINTSSTQELLDFALHEAVNLTESKIGYIYFYNENTRQFTLNTWSREVMKECRVMNPETVYDLDTTGCWGEAVRQRKPIIINDYEAENPYKKGTPQGHVALKKFLTIPVFSDNEIVAVAGVANKKSNYNQSDVRQLTLLMDKVWKIAERIRLIEDLKVAKEKAEESDKLKSAFLANMSHEIRTPMNGIMGFTELLKDPSLSGEQQNEFISIIQKSGDRMLSTINDIIDISKIESGLVSVDLDTIDLKSFLTDIKLFFEPETTKKQLYLNFSNENDQHSPTFEADTVKLNSIISNLIKNAVKFTREGGITFGYEIIDDAITFVVKDTGIGIPENRQQAIFDRFVQADIADSRVFEGSGLGLSISKSYTEMLGGTIKLESKENEGTTFYIRLPYKKPADSILTFDEYPSATEKLPGNLKIMIAEDDPVSVELLKIVLGPTCNEMIVAENGQKAIDLAREHPDLDLILMDIKMPEVDGYEATEEIRKFNAKVKIIAQTAFAQDQDALMALNVGCNDFITKPVNKKELFQSLSSLFAR
ncbi:PAS domain S-box protein [uncultured Draconibacterium sp.]|uniref:PAS domain S-box protein n=1 Tax=uncultured Draconibacterium sp. TaxID=1573823 RepID=UPI00325FE16F